VDEAGIGRTTSFPSGVCEWITKRVMSMTIVPARKGMIRPRKMYQSSPGISGQAAKPGARCKSKTSRHNQDRSCRATNHRHILTRPVLIVATGLGVPTRPRFSGKCLLNRCVTVCVCVCVCVVKSTLVSCQAQRQRHRRHRRRHMTSLRGT